MSASQYARLVPKKYRTRWLPKINRPIRPRVIAWAGPSAFYPNRFYEIDKWYKARIDKPEKLPKMHIIDPANYVQPLEELLRKTVINAINIGYQQKETPVKKTKSEVDKAELERLSRHLKLEVNLDNVDFPNLHVCRHYLIFDHLFGEGTYFHNVQNFEAAFNDNQVYNGNILNASTTSSPPMVSIEKVGNDGFNTLLMVNLDGNAFEKSGEVIQWLVSNIPDGSDIAEGDQVIDYLQPLPFYGTGYHRVALVLFRHSEKIDFSNLKGTSLFDRVQPISEIYKKHENVLTPSSIRFFQTSYDNSVKNVLHSLGMKSPLYEYKYNEPLKPEQREFPEKSQPFDLYLDMYRDPKDVETEILEKRLSEAQLDNYKEPQWRDIDYNENKKRLPSWLHSRILSRKGPAKAQYVNKID
ncbi:unnamed protein product [Caenorhabditis bovis]|uniref:39S ribosomal protein L38, mitochondrial n=1 Tax=Caenorhabditis bovis TaxID=2654633 RepID=A0A8S1FC49_9PELO|nr:unnamed protein product [Caenorhabditis bovis]